MSSGSLSIWANVAAHQPSPGTHFVANLRNGELDLRANHPLRVSSDVTKYLAEWRMRHHELSPTVSMVCHGQDCGRLSERPTKKPTAIAAIKDLPG